MSAEQPINVTKEDFGTNEVMSKSRELDDNQSLENKIIDEPLSEPTSNNHKEDTTQIIPDTVRSREDNDLESYEMPQQSENEAFATQPEELNTEHEEENADKEEFKMPDNFDLPEDYFISMKRNRISHPSSTKTSLKRTHSSLTRKNEAASSLVREHDTVIKEAAVHGNDQIKSVSFLPRDSFSSAKRLHLVSISKPIFPRPSVIIYG